MQFMKLDELYMNTWMKMNSSLPNLISVYFVLIWISPIVDLDWTSIFIINTLNPMGRWVSMTKNFGFLGFFLIYFNVKLRPIRGFNHAFQITLFPSHLLQNFMGIAFINTFFHKISHCFMRHRTFILSLGQVDTAEFILFIPRDFKFDDIKPKYWLFPLAKKWPIWGSKGLWGSKC